MTAIAPGRADPIDLLVLDGLLFGSLDLARARGGWLLGAEDLVRPHELATGMTWQTAWRALVPTRVALLDADFARLAAPIPGVMSELLSRAHRTSHWLLSRVLLVSSPRIEERLMFLFALLGERWGRVTREGVYLPLQMTHALVACLVGARRPSVTSALKSLHDKDIVRRDAGGGWRLGPETCLAVPAAGRCAGMHLAAGSPRRKPNRID